MPESQDPPPEETPEAGACCAHCGTPLLGRWCYRCGQENHDPLRRFLSLLGDSLENVFHFDARLRHTLVPLLLRPGALTLEYLRGHRVTQVAPFRLMFFLALAAFFVFRLALPPPHVRPVGGAGKLFAKDRTPAAVARTRGKLLAKIRKGLEDKNIPLLARRLLRAEEGGILRAARARDLALAGRGTAIPDGSSTAALAPASGSRALTYEIEAFTERFLRRLPLALVLLMPIFALILKAFFPKRLYGEHLLVALHSHAFLFLDLLLAAGLEALGRAGAVALPWLPALCKPLWILLLLWIPVYLVLMQKRVYGLGWRRTLLTAPPIAVVYAVPLTALVALTLALSAGH